MFEVTLEPAAAGKQAEIPTDVKIQAMNPLTIKVACSNCNLRELCLPMGLNADELDKIDKVVAVRRKVKRGSRLYGNGEKFTSLFAIRTGFFKTCITTEDGRNQVTGFQMAGEIMGLDGIVKDHHTCDAVALEDAEVCVMPFDRIEELSRDAFARQHARRGTFGGLSAEPGPAVACPRLFSIRTPAAHDARGNRQLSGTEA
jgi:CRP/FNR family transcriptional regulator, anaerobic regulatory protein